ncbi:MAG: HNH endonuclease [Candidatus Cloacimonadota bacterium]|nr:HNH endonuclease [Candidatus Cloacimonadota bacterium]
MFNDTKYGIVYIKIIEKSKMKNRIKLSKHNNNYVYYEEHHIVPRSIDETLIHEKDNLVLLTAKEHFICHILIWKHFKKLKNIRFERKMSKAIRQLNNNGKYNSKIYEKLKMNLSHSEETKKKISENSKSGTKKVREKLRQANLGKTMSEESKIKRKETWNNKSKEELEEYSRKLSKSLKGRPKPKGSGTQKGFKHSEETKIKISESREGLVLSEKHKKNISISMKGKPKPKYEYTIFNGSNEIIDMDIKDFPHNFKQTSKENVYGGGRKKNMKYKGWYVTRKYVYP